MIRTTTVLFAIAVLVGAAAAGESLVTDRPDQTESSVTVPIGHVQVEAGWTMTRNEEGTTTVDVHEVPGVLVRTGIHERIELRLGWSGHVSVSSETDGITTESVSV